MLLAAKNDFSAWNYKLNKSNDGISVISFVPNEMK
jgi:hypothetical protein